MAVNVLPPPASLPRDQMTTEAWFLSRWTMFWARATHALLQADLVVAEQVARYP